MTRQLYGREYQLYEVVNWIEDLTRERQPGYAELYEELQGWVKRAAERLARDHGGEVEYAEVGEVCLALPNDDE